MSSVSGPSSPRIRGVAWGSVTLEDGRRFKDVKLYPGGAREWDWRETGTQHLPGIQLADAQEILDHGATAVVLSRGQVGRLEVMPETLRALQSLGIEVHVHKTRKAVKIYNELRRQTPAGALIHSTC